MARHSASAAATPGVSVHATGVSSVGGVGAAREFGSSSKQGRWRWNECSVKLA
jgi:hypothetical protein